MGESSIVEHLFHISHFIIMPSYYLYAFLLLLLFFHLATSILPFNNTLQIKCIEREREALLDFKHGLIEIVVNGKAFNATIKQVM